MRMRQKAAWILILMLGPWSVWAQENSDLRSYLRSVNSLYGSFEYEQALKQLERAQRFAWTIEDDALLSLYEGLILAEMSNWDASAAAFRAALSLQPDSVLPLKASPKVEAYFEKVRREVVREMARMAPKGPVAVRPEPSPQPVETQGAAASTAQPVPKRKPSPEALPKEASAPLGVDARSSVTEAPAGSRWRRTEVLAPAIAGGVLVLAGGTSWLLSRREASLLDGEGESFNSREDVHRSASRGKTYQSVGAGLLGAGVVGLGVAAGLYFWSPTQEMKLGVVSNGTSAVIYGRWQ
jgi:tetratricopeptide (TPR) repeat protein